MAAHEGRTFVAIFRFREDVCVPPPLFVSRSLRPLAQLLFQDLAHVTRLLTLLSVFVLPFIVVMLYLQPLHAYSCNRPVVCGGLISAALPEETTCPGAATV